MKPTKQYKSWLAELKQNISTARLQTSLQVNANMLMVYWYIGKQLSNKVEKEKWGAKVIEQLAKDLQKAFPDTKGFSYRNLKYMRQFAEAYSSIPIGQTVSAQLGKATSVISKQNNKKQIGQSPIAQLHSVEKTPFGQSLIAQISWTHHVVLLNKIADAEERLWYIEQSIANGWSVRVLDYQIGTNLYQRQHKKKKTTNFHLTLPKEQSDLANQILKDPYNFEFLQIGKDVSEHTTIALYNNTSYQQHL